MSSFSSELLDISNNTKLNNLVNLKKEKGINNIKNIFIEDSDKDIIFLNKKSKRNKKKKKLKKGKNINNENENESKNKKYDNEKKNIEEINQISDYKLNPINITYFNDLINDSYTISYSDNTFIIFKSFSDILFLIYSNKNNSIVSFNLIDNKKINEIKNAHSEFITNFRHYLDNYNERDLILSISAKNNNLKVWNFNNYECLYNFEKINKTGYLNSACFLNYNHNIYIITSHYRFSSNNTEAIKVFDLKGNKIKEIDDSNDQTVFIDTFYDKKLSKIFIITGNYNYVKSYDYEYNNIYQKYNDNDYKYHDSIIIKDNEEIIKMIESSGDGNIRIWNFHTTQMIQKIRVNKTGIYGICFWNKEYILVGSKKIMKLINIKKEKKDKNLKGHSNEIVTIKKMIHPQYGECVISQDRENYSIKIWIVDYLI